MTRNSGPARPLGHGRRTLVTVKVDVAACIRWTLFGVTALITVYLRLG
jgi:hypothetical protein